MRLFVALLAVSVAYIVGRFAERSWWMQDRPVREPDEADAVQPIDPRLTPFPWPGVLTWRTGTDEGWTCSYGHRHKGADICVMN